MQFIGQIAFYSLFITALIILARRINIIKKNIQLGHPIIINDHIKDRWRNVFLLALGQKKMFNRLVPAVLHLLIYVGFIVINIEILEFLLDGLSGNHRIFVIWLQAFSENTNQISQFYNVIMNLFELLTLGVIFSCIIFLIRRNILRLKRFSGIEMTNWPRLDANLILIFEIILMLAILMMNAADQVLQEQGVAGYPETGILLISKGLFYPLLKNLNPSLLILVERSAWWFHIIGILGFGIYVTYSKHLHIVLAFPNTYYSNLNPPGQQTNMPDVTREVRMMLGLEATQEALPEEIQRLGTKDVNDLTWKNIMDAYSCTECGRCTSVCPANLSGKILSPRKIMMDVRDRVEEYGMMLNKKEKSLNEKSLFNYITKEEIFACTTCNACIEACPVSIDPVSVIIQMRRYIAMEESSSPNDWNIMFNNLETNFSPWKFPISDRFKWADEILSNK